MGYIKDNTPDAEIRYNIYASKHAPVNINLADNIITADLYGTSFTYNIPEDQSPFLYFAITAVDRFGNESQATQFYHVGTDDGLLIENDGSTLNVPQHLQAEALYVTDLTGRKIRRYSDVRQLTIDDLPPGFYQLKMMDKKGYFTLLGNFMK